MVIKNHKGRKSFNFDVREIISTFNEKNTEDQVTFIRLKLNELITMEDMKLNLLNRIKKHYLIKRKHIWFILLGLLYQAEKWGGDV